MAFANALVVLDVAADVACACLERRLLQVEIVAALPGRTFRKLAAIVVSLVGLVRLVDGEALLAIFLVGRVLQVFAPQRQNDLICLHVPLSNSGGAEGLVRACIVIL